MRLKINHFCGNIYNFQEKLQENVKMQITKRPIKIFIIILKRGNQNTTNYKYKNSIEYHCFYILNVFLHIKRLALLFPIILRTPDSGNHRYAIRLYYNPISGCPRKNSPTKKLRPNNLKFHIFSNSENYKRKIHYTKIIKTCIKIHVFIQDKI